MPKSDDVTSTLGGGIDDDPEARKPEDPRPTIKVEDRRHWARREPGEADEEVPSLRPTIVDAYQRRAEEAEEKLREYIAAYRQSQAEQEQFRVRLTRDVDRRVELRFAALVAELLDSVDDLDLALSHSAGTPGAEPLAKGVALARDRFLSTLERNGVTRLDLDGAEFDPNVAEAVQIVEAASPEENGRVSATLRPGYRMGERIVRPARVAVARRREG